MSLVTRESDGKAPTYEQLEVEYVRERMKREKLQSELKAVNLSNARLRYEIKSIKDGFVPEYKIKA